MDESHVEDSLGIDFPVSFLQRTHFNDTLKQFNNSDYHKSFIVAFIDQTVVYHCINLKKLKLLTILKNINSTLMLSSNRINRKLKDGEEKYGIDHEVLVRWQSESYSGNQIDFHATSHTRRSEL